MGDGTEGTDGADCMSLSISLTATRYRITLLYHVLSVLMCEWLTEIRPGPGLVRDVDHTPTLKAVVLSR